MAKQRLFRRLVPSPLYLIVITGFSSKGAAGWRPKPPPQESGPPRAYMTSEQVEAPPGAAPTAAPSAPGWASPARRLWPVDYRPMASAVLRGALRRRPAADLYCGHSSAGHLTAVAPVTDN